ncbi:MAG: serine/threonine-protein kinase [Phycisphaerales bacterium]|nr:serine/threonine-protein kinase [Phycisphaerales bacterium]
MSDNAAEEFESNNDTREGDPLPYTEDCVPDSTHRTGQKIGPCTLRRLIGTGGMGAVYEAVQENPRRTVAIKLMRRGIVSRAALRRFEFESQILARLRHPGIAQVYEAGTHEDGGEETPYFIMEYIPGAATITDYARRHDLTIRDRMKLFLQVCSAVQHGHLKGIVHRDLKPGNILISSNGQPKIIDFGVARSTDSDLAMTTLQTDVGQILGTLQYMSPEQCAADPNDIDTRSDVYALGVVLHELLTGSLPYDIGTAALHEAVRVIREDSPVRLSSIDRRLKGDLETITGKALEKERRRRYQSASALADDIGHWLDDEPINARAPSAMDMLLRFARRHTAAATAIIAVFLTLLVAITITTLSATEASRQRELAMEAQDDQARQRESAEKVKDFLKEMIANVDPARSGKMAAAGMSEMLERASERIDTEFPEQPLLQAELRTTLGDTWAGLGDYEQTLAEYQVALTLREEHLGAESKEALLAKGRVASALDAVGRQGEAIEAFSQQIEGMTSVFELDDPALLKAKVDLADVYVGLGRLADAEVLLGEIIDTEVLDTKSPSDVTVTAKVLMGMVAGGRGDADGGEQWFVEAQADFDRLGDTDHILRHRVRYNLAVAKARQEATDEAIAMLQQLLKDSESGLGQDHPHTLTTAGTLGAVFANSGDLAAAEPYLQRVYEGQLRVHGAEHPHTLVSLANLGNMQAELNKIELAEVTARMALGIAMRARGPDDQLTHLAQRLMARVHLAQGELAEAEMMAQSAVDGAVSLYGENSGYTVLSLDMLIQVLDAKGDTEAADAARARVQRISDEDS